jgi:uncharacterized repeat protein (TIGR03803 family)
MKRAFTLLGACLSAALLTACGGSKSLPVGPSSGLTSSTDVPPQGAQRSASTHVSKNGVIEKVLHSFEGGATDGSTPISGLLQVGNLLYGTSGGGGTYNKGTIFSISPAGTGCRVLYSFQGKKDGSGPAAGLTALNGTLYGTAAAGGAHGNGTVFSVTRSGSFVTLYSFKGGSSDGARPMAALTNVGGTLYGTTADGGRAGNYSNCGAVFSISTGGQYKVRYVFAGGKDDGCKPESPLVNVAGKLYGATVLGGIGGFPGNGTIFSVTPGGTETVLHRFKGVFISADGQCGFNCYLTNLGETLYGTAYNGGKDGLGSVFSIKPSGAFKTLYSASGKGDGGGYPNARLINVGGALYGTMSEGPSGKRGTVFSVTTAGSLKTIFQFSGGSKGAKPSSNLTFVGGKLYGTTANGGSKNEGTIYAISGF